MSTVSVSNLSTSTHVTPTTASCRNLTARRLSAAGLVAVLLIGLLAVVPPGQASANTDNGGTGSYGNLTYVPYVDAIDFKPCASPICVTNQTLRASGLSVTRSPASLDSQVVVAVFTVFRWTAYGWVLQGSSWARSVIPAGYALPVQLPAWTFTASPPSRSWYTVEVQVQWQTPTRGVLGNRYFAYNGFDYRCLRALTMGSCQSQQGAIYLGGYY